MRTGIHTKSDEGDWFVFELMIICINIIERKVMRPVEDIGDWSIRFRTCRCIFEAAVREVLGLTLGCVEFVVVRFKRFL